MTKSAGESARQRASQSKRSVRKTGAKYKTSAKKLEATKVNKSQAIREYMAMHPDAGPNAVSHALQDEGIDVTPGFVSTIKSMDKKRGGDESMTVTSAELESIPAATLLKAKKMAEQLGGVRNARAIFDALARIVD